MPIEVYLEPPPFCFSGNPIVIGVKDTGLLASNTEQHCIYQIRFLNGPATPYSLQITYNGTNYYFQDTDGTMFPAKYKKILPLKLPSETLTQFTERFTEALRGDPAMNDYFYIEVTGIWVYLIEREPVGDPTILMWLISQSESTYITKTIITSSKQINLGEPHYIGIVPEILVNINMQTHGGMIDDIPVFYGKGIEIESDVFIEETESMFTKLSDGSLYKDIDVSGLVRYSQKGHFDIGELYTVRDLAQRFSFYCYAIQGVPPVRQRGMRYSPVRVVDAEITRTMQARLNALGKSLWQYLIDTKMPMTWAPDNKKIDVYAPERLYYPFKEDLTDVTYHCRETFSDDTDDENILATFNATQYQVVELSAAFMDIRSESGKTVVKYELWLENSDEVFIMEVRTFYMDYRYQPYARWWMFKNGFGVYECLRTTGKAVKSVTIEKVFIEKKLPQNFTETDRTREQMSNTNELRIKCSSGSLERDWAQYYIELFDSEDVYLLSQGDAIPAEIEASEFVYLADGENISPHVFEATLGSLDEDIPDTSIVLPIAGDFNGDFNESFFIGT